MQELQTVVQTTLPGIQNAVTEVQAGVAQVKQVVEGPNVLGYIEEVKNSFTRLVPSLFSSLIEPIKSTIGKGGEKELKDKKDEKE